MVVATTKSVNKLTDVAPLFLRYAQIELQFSLQTIQKYEDCLRQVSRLIGNLPVTEYTKEHILLLKSGMLSRQHSVGRQVSILSAFKGLLGFCRGELGLPVLASEVVTMPKRPRREVVFLTLEEVEAFTSAIRTQHQDGTPFEAGLRFRALVEILLGSAMRIGEALSLNRVDVSFADREARIIGKGNKQRTVFFTERALDWLSRYLSVRTDKNPALFATQGGRSRLGRDDIWRPFMKYRRLARLNKRVTPHLLRHTAATQLLFNGCPVGHIKEILGHERLETTCRYYLGLDLRAAKAAHQKFLVYHLAGSAQVG